ncbi:MAG: protein-glutamate O-methyltransferase CheR [Deltaproteobacteria bacterium]|nr:protein-glutamate O-methyltransferase CheR [Deltaproteobacteria bacterium]
MHFDEFLKEVAPCLGLQWRPFQRRGVKRKIERRIIELGFSRFDEYLLRVQKDPEEKSHLSKILTVTISRFFRDKEVFDTLETSALPAIIKNREKGDLNVWSIGCASGEEPYSVSLLWKEKFGKDFPEVRLSVLATDIDEKMLRRAEEGRYKKSSLRETPQEILEKSFNKEDGFFILNPSVRKGVEFKRHDILREEPFPGMDIIFCRNLAFTYFSKESQMKVLKKIFSSLKEKGYLVIGRDESLPLTFPTLFIPIFPAQKFYQRFSGALNLAKDI